MAAHRKWTASINLFKICGLNAVKLLPAVPVAAPARTHLRDLSTGYGKVTALHPDGLTIHQGPR